MKKITKWLDRKLEKYREPKEDFTPKSTKELVEVLKRTPKNVLSAKQKNMFAAMMSIKERHVSDIMVPKEEMTFVKDDEVLGPLMLDKLYQSGFSHFPVVDKKGKIIGVIDTESLNSLKIKESAQAKELLNNEKITFLKPETTLNEVIDEFLRTNTLFFAIIDKDDEMIGVVTFEMIIYYLLGEI